MGEAAALDVGYVREVRWAGFLTVRGEFRIITGIMLGAPAAITAIFAAQGQLPWVLPAVFAAVGAAAMVSLSRVDRGPEAKVAESLESGEMRTLLADLRGGAAGAETFRRVFDGGFGFRRGRFTGAELDRPESWTGRQALAWEWMADIDAENGVLEAEAAAAKGDPVREFDGTPYLSYARFTLAYGDWLRSEGYRDDGDYNPFRRVLNSNGRLVAAGEPS